MIVEYIYDPSHTETAVQDIQGQKPPNEEDSIWLFSDRAPTFPGSGMCFCVLWVIAPKTDEHPVILQEVPRGDPQRLIPKMNF